MLDGVDAELATAGDDLLGDPVSAGRECQVVAAQPGGEHGELDRLLKVHAVAGKVEVQDAQQVHQLGFGKACGLGPLPRVPLPRAEPGPPWPARGSRRRVRASRPEMRGSAGSGARLVTIARSTGSPCLASSRQASAILLRMDGPPVLLAAVRYSPLTGVRLSTAYLTCL